jgi:alpha-beta hydrolase superfamily lysophospholipase
MLRSANKLSGQSVILLHGFGRTSDSMAKIGRALRLEGYRITNLDYPSTREPIDSLVRNHLAPAVHKAAASGSTVNFVTHSLGGILVRCYLEKYRKKEPSRVIMLSPPNQGSEVAEYLKHHNFFRKALGPAGQELGTGRDSIPLGLGGADFDLGVICGNRTSDPWFSFLFNEPNDGKVSVSRASLAGMSDFLVVPHGHTFIMRQPEVISQVAYYLKTGQFDRRTDYPQRKSCNPERV